MSKNGSEHQTVGLHFGSPGKWYSCLEVRILCLVSFKGALWSWEIHWRNTLDGNILAKGECNHSYSYKTIGHVFCWWNIKQEVRQDPRMIRLGLDCPISQYWSECKMVAKRHHQRKLHAGNGLPAARSRTWKISCPSRVAPVCLVSKEKSFLYVSK